MLRFVLRRLITSVLVLAVLTVIVFVLARIVPSDPAVIYAGPKAPPAELDRVRQELGFDRPMIVQYFEYVKNLLTGDWGNSLATKRPVLDELFSRLPATLELIGFAMCLAVLAGVFLGVVASRRPGKFLDGTIRFLSIGGISVPAFWLGLLLQLLFVGGLGVLPATGQFSNSIKYSDPITHITGFPLFDSLVSGNGAAFQDGLQHMILPALTLAAYPLGLMARMTRAAMLDVMNQDYIFTAQAYGLKEVAIRWRLALKNALPPVLSIAGMATAYALTGTFFVEAVFNWPGIGQFATSSMLAVDYPAIMAITLMGATAYLLANLLVDILQSRIDPRVRMS